MAAPTTSQNSHSAPSSYQSPAHPTLEQKTWTLTDTPRSTPLMAVCSVNGPPKREVWTVDVIPEATSLDSSFTTSSLSDLSTGILPETPRSASLTSVSFISLPAETDICDPDLKNETRLSASASDLEDETVQSSAPFTTKPKLGLCTTSAQTFTESSLSPRPSSPSLSLLPTASDESTTSVSMASHGTSSSTESCKTPVAARNEVVITMDDHVDNIIYPGDKSGSEVLNVVKDVDKESSKEQVVITMGTDNDRQSSNISYSESESSSGEMIFTSQESEMRNVTTEDVVIDIMGCNNDNEETSTINEKCNQGKILLARSKCELSFHLCSTFK